MNRSSTGMVAIQARLRALPGFQEVKRPHPFAIESFSIDFESVRKALRVLDAIGIHKTGSSTGEVQTSANARKASIQAIVRENFLSQTKASTALPKP